MQQSAALKYTEIARRFLQAATGYLNEGDLIQASEKLWGATAHAIKVYSCSGFGGTQNTLICGVQ